MDDLTKVGHVPKRRGAHKSTSLLSKFHCVDHTVFRESCHNCLVIAVISLLARVEHLEDNSHVHDEQPPSIRYEIKDKANLIPLGD